MSEPIYFTVRINDKCQPLDRGDLYEDPLTDALESAGLGEVDGGGSQLNEKYQIEYCELEVRIDGDLEKAKALIIKTLEEVGIPKGSRLLIEGEDDILFGKAEVLALSFDNQLPAEVYEQHDINDVIEKLHKALGDTGAMTSHWDGEERTIVFFTGPSFETIKDKIQDLVATHPLCQQAEVYQDA